MLLVIDVGNTNIVYGVFDGDRLAHQFRVESGRGRTADEFAVTLRQLLDMNGVAPSSVKAAIIASVVISRLATEAASCNAVRTTLVGSMMPAATRSLYSPVCASKPKL